MTRAACDSSMFDNTNDCRS